MPKRNGDANGPLLEAAAISVLGELFGDDVVSSVRQEQASPGRSSGDDVHAPHLDQLIDVLAHAIDVLGDLDTARSWIHRGHVRSLGKSPLELIQAGDVQEVEHALGRIEHGVYD